MAKSKYDNAMTLLNTFFYLALIGIIFSIWLTKWSLATKLFITSIIVIIIIFILYYGVKEAKRAEGKIK